MQQMFQAVDSPFAVLSFLAAPAILTNASTLLALGTSNRLARAADRARLAAEKLVSLKDHSDPMVKFQHDDFHNASVRAQLLVKALRRFYTSAGCFALGTCVALVGAFLDYFHIRTFDMFTQALTLIAALTGVGGLMHGSWTLLAETRIALRVLDQHHAAITMWRANQLQPTVPPTI
jgi:hypothetical protein